MVVLSRGDRGEPVKALQRCLHLYEDGIFGPMTEDAVRQYQREHGLRVDGVVGLATWDSLGVHPWMRVSAIAVRKSKRRIDEIIVHCSATAEGRHYAVEDIIMWCIWMGQFTKAGMWMCRVRIAQTIIRGRLGFVISEAWRRTVRLRRTLERRCRRSHCCFC